MRSFRLSTSLYTGSLSSLRYLDVDELIRANAPTALECVMKPVISGVQLYPTASNSKCCWCTQTCKFVFPRASYARNETPRAPGSPLPQTSEAATVWAGTCNRPDWQGWRQRSLLGTQTMAKELDCDCGLGSKSGCLFSAGLGKKPWPSTLLAARAAFCAGLPSGRLRRWFAGGSGKRRLHPPGPGGAGRRPPRE